MDVWGAIKSNIAKGWFISSRAEWAVFASELEINKSNYESLNLKNWYWSSSQSNIYETWYVYFYNGYMDHGTVNGNSYVRLSKSF